MRASLALLPDILCWLSGKKCTLIGGDGEFQKTCQGIVFPLVIRISFGKLVHPG